MKELEKKIQELGFDVETQYCDPSDCYHDCYGKGGSFMEKLEIRMQEELFDVETQYCDPDDCYHDCKLNVPNYCNEVVTLYW